MRGFEARLSLARCLRRRLVEALILLSIAAPAWAAAPLPLERTLAYRMLKREQAVRPVSDSAEPLLRTVLRDAVASLGPNSRAPATGDEFKAFAAKVGVALATHNFVQPGSVEDWPDTIGEALTPIDRDDPRAAQALRLDVPGRVGHVSRTGPIYLVDCDIGSMLIISVAEMVGFPVAMVEVPRHNFVRWQGASGARVNWDWTNWRVRDDGEWTGRLKKGLLSRKIFLASQTLAESEGYFKSVLAAKVDDQPAKLALRREAAAAFPNNRVVAHGVAHAFARSPAATVRERQEALGYGLLALSMEGNSDPESIGHRWAVVACAYAAHGEWELATAFANRAVAAVSGGDAVSYRNNVDAIKARQTCPRP